jgi:pimeloyl-ACP methyl ester carboxylesterase
LKYRITTGQKIVVLEKGLPGSIDCYFSLEYSKITAINLSILCQIAYWDDLKSAASHFIQETIQAGKRSKFYPYVFRSFSKEKPISDWQTFEYAPGGLTIIDTQGYSFQDPENIYIAFRGTEVRPRDILTDLSATSTPFPYGSGRVHSGFSDAFAAVVPKLSEILSNCDKAKKVIVCGHSLGGALATLCAAWVRETTPRSVMLYTFGSPRVGCRDFVEHYSKTASFPAFRVADPKDIVPSLPWGTAGGDLEKIENLPSMVMENPMGWILEAVSESSHVKPYQHFGTSVSLRSPGYTIVGSPSAMDGEFAHGVQNEWRRLSMREFISSNYQNFRHHLPDEYQNLLRADFLDDCRNWAYGDSAHFLLQAQNVDSELANVESQIREQAEPYAAQDASATSRSRTSQVKSEDKLHALEIQRDQLRFQADTLRQRAHGATEEQNNSLLRLTHRPMDKYLRTELLYHASGK